MHFADIFLFAKYGKFTFFPNFIQNETDNSEGEDVFWYTIDGYINNPDESEESKIKHNNKNVEKINKEIDILNKLLHILWKNLL